MKKRCSLTLCLSMMPLAALAGPMTWYDSTNFNTDIDNGNAKSYARNISDHGIDLRSDWILGNRLLIGMHRSSNDEPKKVKVGHPRWLSDGAAFNAQDTKAGRSILRWFPPDLSSLVNVNVDPPQGDIYWESSTLWTKGNGHNHPTSVPEPGSLGLLGLGLVGLGLARRHLRRDVNQLPTGLKKESCVLEFVGALRVN